MGGVEGEHPALRLARYMKELVGLRTTVIRDIEQYDEVLWFSDIPQEDDCRSGAWLDGVDADDAWLEVRKQEFEPPPELPPVLLPWMEDRQAFRRAATEMPPLRPSLHVPDEEVTLEEGETPPLVERMLTDHPEIQAAYNDYRPVWESWSEEHLRREAIQKVYADLFRLRTQLLKQGELVEVVLGLGLLDWRTGLPVPVRRHAVVASVDLKFDADAGVIRVETPGDGARLRLEDEMLEGELRPDRADYQIVEELLAEIDDEVWDEARMHGALRVWARALDADAQWYPEIKARISETRGPVMSFAPALILRNRPQTGVRRIYDQIIEQLSCGSSTIPEGWRGLIVDGVFGANDSGPPEVPQTIDTEDHSTQSELYFPLPTNRQQRQIVDVLRRQRGVLVQGPPGTGKSHTIANLICHFLATGERVLITAETPQALRVIKDKIPEDLKPLCISLLGQGGDAFAELNMAVEGIARRQQGFVGGDDERIAEVEADIENARRHLAELDSELSTLRADETCKFSIADGTYIGTASAIARRVASERERYGWLSLPADSDERPPLSNADMIDWLRVLRDYSDEQITQAQLRTPTSSDLPTPEEFAAAVASERSAAEAFDRDAAIRSHIAYTSVSALSPDAQIELADRLRDIERRRHELALGDNRWLRTIISDSISERPARWDTVIELFRDLLVRMEFLRNRVEDRIVEIHEDRDRRAVFVDAKTVLYHLNGGGKWKRFGLFTPRDLKGLDYLKHEVRVNGIGAADSHRLSIVCDHLQFEFARYELGAILEETGAPSLPNHPKQALAVAAEHLAAMEAARRFADECAAVPRTLTTASQRVPLSDWLNGEAGEWLKLIDASAVEDRHRKAIQVVDSAGEELAGLRGLHDAHPVVAAFDHAVARRDIRAYSEHYAEVVSIEKLLADQEKRFRIEKILATEAPSVIGNVTPNPEKEEWADRLGAWGGAWSWVIADSWLESRSDPSYRQTLEQRRHEIEIQIRDLLAAAAALRAWGHFFSRLSPGQAAALRGWRQTVRSMGKGTGKSARLARLRREARSYMDECRDAIPVWIMPRYLVAEMVNPLPGLYDLIIADEASQLGIDSAFLLYITKKMVVVGDEEQISPHAIGVPDSAISDLQRRYLDEIPHQHALAPQISLYANANIRFGNPRIVLREHFRCVPEIIQFSNDLCYAPNGTPLDPLRTYPAKRHKPLVVRHVPDGYATGSRGNVLNVPEADAIVDQVAACIGDPRYDNTTMGIISLQGGAQARLIERKLLERLDTADIEKRRLICGDAYAFQGDERDIMFLSMVAAATDENGEARRIGTLSDGSARQRFNVAASRARDQLWLFHTAELHMLGGQCLRHRLLDYMLEPRRAPADGEKARFESEFEREVFGMISEKGFHVRTQVGVGDTTSHRYRIDLVVEGMQGRLAVECDGERWHGPERYEQDMSRQRDLERAGWRFVRIRGGDFYRDRDGGMEPVWQELDRLNIMPGGIDGTMTKPPTPTEPERISAASPDSGFKDVTQVAEDRASQLQPSNDGNQTFTTVEYIPFWVGDSCETVGRRLIDLFKAEPTNEDRREMMDLYIDFLYYRDLYPHEEINDLHYLRTPAELVWATVSFANRRIDDLMAMFPGLYNHPEPERLIEKLIPDLETFLGVA